MFLFLMLGDLGDIICFDVCWVLEDFCCVCCLDFFVWLFGIVLVWLLLSLCVILLSCRWFMVFVIFCFGVVFWVVVWSDKVVFIVWVLEFFWWLDVEGVLEVGCFFRFKIVGFVKVGCIIGFGGIGVVVVLVGVGVYVGGGLLFWILDRFVIFVVLSIIMGCYFFVLMMKIKF